MVYMKLIITTFFLLKILNLPIHYTWKSILSNNLFFRRYAFIFPEKYVNLDYIIFYTFVMITKIYDNYIN